MAIKLDDIRVPISRLLLDPDNYRVAKKAEDHISSLEEIHESQPEIMKSLKKQKLADLKDSILKNGFLTVDRIVVKQLQDNNYLVIEGNRRVAAFKSIISDYEKGYLDTDIGQLLQQSEAISAVQVKGTQEEIQDYSNALMGIRHVSGAKKWHGWQSAKLVNNMYESGHSLTDIGLMLGITAIDAGRRMRGYKAFQQLENDSKWGDKKETHHYGLLLEYLAPNRKAKTWLGWSDNSMTFTNTDQLHRVYKAITKTDDGTYEVRNIDDAREFIKRLDTKSGQEKLMEVSDFRQIDLDEIKSNSSTVSLILALLNTISLDQLKDEQDITNFKRIKSAVDKLSEGIDGES